MKKKVLLLLAALTLSCVCGFSQTWDYYEASDLTICGKVFPHTPNVYHRIDTEVYSGFDKMELDEVHMSAGIVVAFQTNSPHIVVKPEFLKISPASSTSPVSQKGFDLYLKKDGRWLWAGCSSSQKKNEANALLFSAGNDVHECLLYLPLFSEMASVQIGVVPGSVIKPLETPFRHRIAVFGSSFTHGTSTSRPGMNYPSQLSRMTGLQFLNLGCAGHCMLQSYFAEALADAEVDAFVFDAFSNPSAEIIKERLFKFIEIIQAKNPGKPLIFQKTIRRENRNFNQSADKKEQEKEVMAERMMREAIAKYKDVYYVTTTNATDPDHTSTADGTHPGDYGYRLWAESVVGPITDILANYGIR